MKVICGSKKSKSTRRFVMALMADPSLFCCFTSLLSLPAVFGHSQIIQIIVLIGAAENHRPPYGSQRMSSVQVYFPAMLTARNRVQLPAVIPPVTRCQSPVTVSSVTEPPAPLLSELPLAFLEQIQI